MMRIILSRFIQNLKRIHLESQCSLTVNHIPKTVSNIQPKRYYKNFGHGREPDPTSRMLMFGLGIAFAVLGSLPWVHQFSDLYEEGEDRYKPEEEKTYQVPVHIRD